MHIEELSIEELKPHIRNARKHSTKQIDRVSKSIKEFGFLNPILVNNDNTIIAGHCRFEAAKKLGIGRVPCLRVEHLTREQVRAYMIADNRLAELSEWDEEILKLELEELISFNFDFDVIGFEDYFKKRNRFSDPEEVPAIEDVEHIVKRGDVWKLGRHFLICGDSLKRDTYEGFCVDSFDLIYTDPPYEMRASDIAVAFNNANSEHIVMICTFKQAAEFYNLDSFNFHFDFVLNAHVPKSFMNHKQPYYTHQNGVYFSKKNARINSIFDCKNARGVRSDKSYWHTIIDSPRGSSIKDHGHSKNINGIIEVLSGFSCNSVIDMFGGSGSTLIACEQFNKTCYMIELNERFCDVIIRRFENYTGEKAILFRR